MWIAEAHTPNDVYYHGINTLIHSERTAFQQMTIADVGAYGRALFLDGCLQTSEGDEPFYHEPIAHVPCVLHAAVENALVLGGGDGGTAREILRWKSLKSLVNVDIDKAVIDACRRHMPSLSNGAFENPKCTLLIDDALAFLQNSTSLFDVIVCDLTDPIEQGPAACLFTLEFFKLVRHHLSRNGVMSLQSGTISLAENSSNLPRLYNTLCHVFPHVRVMQVFAPKYGTPLALTVASMQPITIPTPEHIDYVFSNQLEGENKVLDGRAFQALFAIPKCVSEALRKETHIFTSADKVKSIARGIMQ